MADRTQHSYGPFLTSPVWAKDFGSRDHILPAGGRVDSAGIVANAQGKKFVPSGTLVTRTMAQRDAKAPYTVVDMTAAGAVPATNETYLIMFDVPDANKVDEVEFYRPLSLVAENYLPGANAFHADKLAWLRTRYTCIVGVD